MGAAERTTLNEQRPPAEEAAAAAARLKEKQLSDTRKGRKEAESVHQAMLNRISFLKSEESKLDRDIENAKRRALELLTRKGEKAEKANDDDVAATAKDILGAVGPVDSPSSRPLKMTTGRSSMREGLAAAAAAAAGTNAKLRSTSAHRTTRTSPSSQPLKPTLSGGARRPSTELAPKSASASGASPSKPPAGKKPSTSPYSSGSPAKPPPARPHGMEVLQRGSDGGEQPSTSSGGGGSGSLNTMDVLNDRRQGGPDQELIEELMAAGSSASHHPGGPEEHLQGLQQFSTDSGGGSKVVRVRATSLKKSGSTKAVLASGVGWGLSGGSGMHPPAPLIADKNESKQLQQELVKKRQLRGVRTAFGLPATVLQDQSASVVEIGAGTWS